MHTDGLVSEALERLIAANLSAVLGVHSVDIDSGERLVISMSTGCTAQTRELIRHVLDDLPYDLLERARAPLGGVDGLMGFKDDQTWRIGTQDEVAWIHDHTPAGLAITSAIPPVFDRYATVVNLDDDDERRASEAALVRLLHAASGDQSWWLGYLRTGAHDVIFADAPMVSLYAHWPYVLVEAGPLQAATWREDDAWRGRLPDLIYPADRSWLVSMLWDDDWRCLGGPGPLIEAVLAEALLDAREVRVDQDDATPPGHIAR